VRFSKAAGITPSSVDDWFDPVLEQDSPLYVDPYLVFDDNDPFWQGSYDRVVQFFEIAAELVLASGGNKNTPAWRKATRLLMFPEPHEFALGVSLGSPRGSGTGEEFAERIADVLALVGGSNVARLASVGGFALFCDGIGVDRISDIICNILKDRFIEYTNIVNGRHGVNVEDVPVRHLAWNSDRGRWRNGNLALFPNDATGGGVLLTPDRFLKDIPRIEPDEFWEWASLTEGAVLRDDLNFDLSESLTKSEKVARARKVARAHPDNALAYLDRVGGEAHKPYDVKRDPRGFVSWYEGGAEAAGLLPAGTPSAVAPQSPDEFGDWVTELAMDFQFVVENTDAWRLLWDDKKAQHRPEKIAQALAGVMWRNQCKLANVDLNKETNVGRGPVDFKFSQGWQRRALLEVKYIGSSHFGSGAAKQLPQYMKSEEIAFGIYLAIGFKDADFKRERLRLVQDTCTSLGAQLGTTLKLVYVDARPKSSASKL